MQSPQEMHLSQFSFGSEPSSVRAFSLHISRHRPQPMQASFSSCGSAAAQNPISLSKGREQALGQAETVALNLWGRSWLENLLSIFRANLWLSAIALLQMGK